MGIKASESVYGFIRGEEKFRAEPYDDGFGNKTVGYGNADSPDKPKTVEEADNDMKNRVRMAEEELSRTITRGNLTQQQQDVLVDMHYNMGLPEMKGFIDLVNSGDDERAAGEILRYVHATDKKTGQKVVAPGLQKRVAKRAELWKSQQAGTSEDDILSAINTAKEQIPSGDDDILAAINSAKTEELEMAQQEDPSRRRSGLELASQAANNEDALRNQEARRLVDRLGISMEDAQARLAEKDSKTIIADHARNTVAEFFPAVAKWAQDPDNYVMLRETEDWPRKIEVAARSLNKDQRSDWARALDQNIADVEQAAIWPQVVFGKISLDQAKKSLSELDARRQSNQLQDSGAKQITQAIDGMDKGGDIWDVIATMAQNPRGTALMALQSGGSSLAPLVAGISAGAAGSLATPVAGVVTGATAAFSTGHLLAYSSYMQKQLEEFRNPQTGEIDYDLAFSDPSRVKQWQREADVYGGVMGVSDVFYSSVGGKFLLKHVAKGGAKNVAKGLAVETAVKGVEEGLSETTALTATDLYAGRLTTERLKKNVKEGQVEAVFGSLIGGPLAAVGAGTRAILEKPKDAAVKTMAIAKQSNKANEDLTALSTLRSVIAEQEEGSDQIKSLIDDTINPPPMPEDPNAPVVDEVETLESSEMKSMDREAEIDAVSISPSEWDEYHKFQGKDPIEALRAFAPNLVQEYARNKSSDSSFLVPVSDWLRFTEEDPAIDVIARINGNTLNGVEANEYADGLEGNEQTLFEKDIDTLPPTPDQDPQDPAAPSDQPITIIDADPNEPSNLAMRPVELYVRGRSDDEAKVFSGILSRLKRSMNEQTDPDGLELFTELQFRHMKNRAEMLGVSIKELDKKLKVGKTTKGESQYAHGVFKYQSTLDSPYTVAFAQSADMKTLVHEFGHSWLHEMAIDYDFIAGIPEASLTDAQREYKNAMDTMAQKSGLANIGMLLSITPAERTRVHETFAQTTELYFLEGKFSDAGMRAIMETFRKWMVEVIERIKAMTYKQYPPLKITPEVERMFEAILGVSAKVEEEIVPMFPEPLFDPAMLGNAIVDKKTGETEGQRYMRTIKDARSQAIGQAYTKAFNRSLREREKLIDKEINRIFDEATEEVDSQRSMILLAGFKEAYGEYDSDSSGNTPDPRLTYESFVKILAGGDEARADELRAQIPREVIRPKKKKDGVPVEQFMMLQGINSPSELLELLLEMGKRDDMINELVEKKIAREFPAMKTDEEIHQVAVDAVNAGGKEKLLMSEVKILMTKYASAYKSLVAKLATPPAYITNPVKETLEAEGIRIVQTASALKFSANKFLVDSYRHGRDAARKFKSNNIEESFESKLKEAVHFYAYKQAREAQKAIANTRVRVKQFIKYSRSKDVLNKYDADVMAYGRQVIQAVGTSQPIPEFSKQGFSQLSGVSTAHIEMINRGIMSFYIQSGGRTGEAISVAGYVQFGELMKSIMFVARKAKEVEIGDKKFNLDQIAEAAAGEIYNGDTVDMSNATAGGKLRRSLVNVRTMFESLYSSPEAFAKSNLGLIFYGVVNAEAERSIALTGYRDRIAKAVREASQDRGIVAPLVNRLPIPAKWKMEDKSSRPIIGSELGMKDAKGNAPGFTFKNKGELHMAMLLMGSESGAKKFLLGHKLSAINPDTLELDTSSWDQFVERMISEGTLTKKDFEMYQEIWKVFDEVHPRVKEAMRRSDGFNMGYIQGKKVKNSLGEWSGGYVPVTPARDLMAPGPIDSLMEVDTMGYRIDGLYPSMNTGMTNERTKAYMELNLDMSRINTYLGAALNIAYLRNPLLDFGKVVESFPVRSALEKRRPGAIGDAKSGVIVRWFNAVKGQEYTEFSDDSHQLIARKLRDNVNMAMYLGNFSSMIKQLFGLVPAVAKVGATHLGMAVLKTGVGARRESRKFMVEKSLVMANRMSGSQEQMVRSWDRLDTNFDWINWTEEKAKGFQWMLIQLTQNMVDTATWHAAYDRAKSKGLDDSQAVNFADDAVSTTQGSPDVSGLANIQRGTDSWKLITMVSSVPIAMHNLMQAEAMRDQSKLNKAKAIIVLGMMAVVIPSILDGAVSDMMDGREPEEDEEEAEEKALGMLALRSAMGSIDTALPIFARPVTSAIMFGASSVSPAVSRLNKVAQSVKASKHIVNGVDLSAKEVASLMDTLTIFTGKPFSAYGKAVLVEEAFFTDEETLEEREDVRQDQLAAIED